MSEPEFSKLVFVFGCARSGTSILGETLAAHPEIRYCFEDNSIWDRVFPGREDDRLLPADTLDVQEELRESASGLLSGPGSLLVDKNPKHSLRIEALSAIFPAAKFVHIIRDGRDAVASLMFRNRGEEWGHLKIPGWRDLLKRYPQENHLRCAHQWRESVRIAREAGATLGDERYHELRYEELVEHAGVTMDELLRFLGLESDSGVSAAVARIQDRTTGSYHARRQVRHFVENHERRVGRYRENLGKEQLAGVLEVCGDLLAHLGYD